MRFAEEILLLLLKEDTGYVVPIPEWQMSCAMAGAVLMDLALERSWTVDIKRPETMNGNQAHAPILLAHRMRVAPNGVVVAAGTGGSE